MKIGLLFALPLLIIPTLTAAERTPLSRPASRPPVYKKFDNKQKKPTVKWGKGKNQVR